MLRIEDGDLFVDRQLRVGLASLDHPSPLAGATIAGQVTVDGYLRGSGLADPPDQLGVGRLFDWGNAAPGELIPGVLGDANVSGMLTVDKGIIDYHHTSVGIAVGDLDRPYGNVLVRGELTVSQGGLTCCDEGGQGGQLHIARNVGNPAAVESLVDIRGPILGYDLITIGSGVGGGTERPSLRGRLIARDSYVQVDTDAFGMRIGRAPLDAFDVSAIFDLRRGYTQIANSGGLGLQVGDGGTIVMHLDGPRRANIENVGELGVYSAMDVDDALLDGVIEADFDFVPAVGTHSFDLLLGGSVGALSSGMEASDFRVTDLPDDFQVSFFGITQDDLGGGSVDVGYSGPLEAARSRQGHVEIQCLSKLAGKICP